MRCVRLASLLAAWCCVSPLSVCAETPHPAVARIIVEEADGVAYGSGTLVDVREQYGLIATNWHVVRDATGKIEVVFPSGFRSEARALKLDEDWDLAALVVWRPPIDPAPLAARAPRPGEPLTICGYGQGEYRSATGRCTEYYAPKVGLPHELVELSVEARQGDSGGPIFNQRGELAGVLFGAGQGTTMGAFGGRVQAFLSTLAADIGVQNQRGVEPVAPPPAPAIVQREPAMVAVAPSPVTQPRSSSTPAAPTEHRVEMAAPQPPVVKPPVAQPPVAQPFAVSESESFAAWQANTSPVAASPVTPSSVTPSPAAPPAFDVVETPASIAPPSGNWFDDVKSLFAIVGVVAVLIVVVKTIT